MSSGEFFRHAGDADVLDAPFHYKRSGLDNIYLLNGFEVSHDDDERYVTVLDVDGLHQAIGLHLVVNRKTLAPKELRFLRKTLNLTQGEMGQLIGQSDQQIARWEKGENHISGPADRLLRLMFIYTLFKCEGALMELPMEFLQKLNRLDAYDEGKVEFCNDGESWLEKA